MQLPGAKLKAWTYAQTDYSLICDYEIITNAMSTN